MTPELFNSPRVESKRIGSLNITVIREPLKALSSLEQKSLADEMMGVVRATSGRIMIDNREVLPYLFGQEGRGKILATVKDADGVVRGFASGHLLNDGSRPLFIEGGRVFHVSSVHVDAGTGIDSGLVLLKEIFEFLEDKPLFISAFIQSPRVYRYVSRFFGGDVYPRLETDAFIADPSLKEVHEKIIDILKFPGQVVNGVFVGKIQGSFYKERQLSRSEAINHWFYDELGLDPFRGDLLLLVTRINQ